MAGTLFSDDVVGWPCPGATPPPLIGDDEDGLLDWPPLPVGGVELGALPAPDGVVVPSVCPGLWSGDVGLGPGPVPVLLGEGCIVPDSMLVGPLPLLGVMPDGVILPPGGEVIGFWSLGFVLDSWPCCGATPPAPLGGVVVPGISGPVPLGLFDGAVDMLPPELLGVAFVLEAPVVVPVDRAGLDCPLDGEEFTVP